MAKKTEVRAPTKAAKPVVKPVTSIVKKRSWLIPVLVVLAVVLVLVVIYAFSAVQSSSKGKVLATVNGEPIYEQDIKDLSERVPAEYRDQYPDTFILNQTIDKLLLLQEAKNRGLAVTDADVDKQMQSILDQFGIKEDDLVKLLESQNSSLEEYRALVREELLLNKIIDDAVLKRVVVSDKDVLDYYDDHQADFTAPAGAVVVSHILVDNESTAADILARLKGGEDFAGLARQYSTDSGSAAQGGYIGVVTADAPYVDEFKNASLALKDGAYTKTPVKSMFGYHIIQRLADVEPFSQVRDRIKQQLQNEQQMKIFQELMQELRSKATIKYYTESGVVTEVAKAGELDGFATCVAGKATLYGSPWSDFFKEQKTLFGTSFAKLSYVDCDENPHLCSAADIQKYPTWVIAGDDQRYGKLTLEQLSAKTGCSLP